MKIEKPNLSVMNVVGVALIYLSGLFLMLFLYVVARITFSSELYGLAMQYFVISVWAWGAGAVVLIAWLVITFIKWLAWMVITPRWVKDGED